MSELRLIVELCREAARRGLNVGMSDARPAAVIRTGAAPWWVTVEDGFYACPAEGFRHPVTDPSGAAAALARRTGDAQ
jgi:hypothetical protein